MESQIYKTIEELTAASTILHEEIDRLTARLEPVSMLVPAKNTEACPGETGQCHVASLLAERATAIKTAFVKLNNLSLSLDLP